jgi:hypothetical protein
VPGVADVEAAKLEEFSDADGSQILWLSDAGRSDFSITSGIQARDVFDLHLLLNRGVQPECLPLPLRKKLSVAMDHALGIDFSNFKSQVVVYLMDEYQDYYYSEQVWTDILTQVVSKLDKVKEL